jgi:ferrochelatase
VQKIGVCLRQFPDSSRIHLLFSAHGIPLSLVEKGDPYPKHIAETVRLVNEQGSKRYANWPETRVLCFQSRVGPMKWLEPSFLGTMERLGHEGVREMLVVPILRHRTYRNAARNQYRWPQRRQEVGIERFRMMPAVGDSAPFIAACRRLKAQRSG